MGINLSLTESADASKHWDAAEPDMPGRQPKEKADGVTPVGFFSEVDISFG
jgi:hypothetical protein